MKKHNRNLLEHQNWTSLHGLDFSIFLTMGCHQNNAFFDHIGYPGRHCDFQKITFFQLFLQCRGIEASYDHEINFKTLPGCFDTQRIRKQPA